MYIGYIKLLKLYIKKVYSSQEMAFLPANDATQADELERFGLPDSRPLTINAILFGGDPHALDDAQPKIATHSGQLAPPPYDILIATAPLAPPPSPGLFHGNHEDVAIVDTAMASAHSGDRYLHYGEESNATGNEIAKTLKVAFIKCLGVIHFSISLSHILNYHLLTNL